MSHHPSSGPAASDGVDTVLNRGQSQHARLVLLIAAVTLAVVGLLSLLTVLLSAWVGTEAWPGFMAAAYFCLPLGFLLMIVSVVVSLVARSRS